MNNKAGVREDDERRRAYRSAITDLQRHRDESLAQFAVRRMRDFAHASQYGVIIPDPFKATLLREGAGLNDQNQQNLSTLLQGQDECPQAVARALSRLDVRSDRMTGFAAGENAPEEDTGSYLGHIPEDEESLDEDDIAHELEALDLTEDQVLEVYAVLDAKRQRPRSWKENKEFKAELKKDRGAFVKGGPVGAGGRERRGELHRSGRTKMNKEQLKKISRCRICMKKGHWAEDCDANKNKKPVVAFAYSSSLQGGASAFSFITFQALYEAVREVQFKEDKSLPSFLTLPSGEAILDTGATQDLIGEVALQSIGIHLNTMASTRAQHPLVSSGSQEASLILEQAINSMSVQNSQLATTLGEINHSLQELARGQGQMIMMTAGMGNPHQALVLSPEQAPSGYDGPEQACIMSPEQAPGGPVLSPEQAPSDYVLSPGQAPGGNFEFVDDKAFRQYRKKRRPRMMMASPACKAFTHLRHIYQERMDPETCRRTVAEGHLMWNFAMEACEEQIAEGNFFGLEHPRLAASWRLPRTQRLLQRDDVVLMSFDQCFFGLSVVPSGTLSRKSTCIATNNPWLALELVNAVCRGDHDHETLIGGLPRKAQEYPAELCSAIARGAQAVALGLNPPSFLESAEVYELTSPGCWFGEEEEEAEDETNPPNEPEQYTTPVSDSQRRLVQKVHVNTGHPDRLRMLRAFKAAGALPQVLRYIREEFGCEDCQLKRGPDNRRRAQLPRTFSFNRVLCADFLFIRFKECQIPIMNLTCAGTSYQIAVRCRETKNGTPTSAAAWRLFMDSWVRYFGAPHLLVTDSGNEFRGAFERGLEFQGILQHVIHPECPWQNGKAERHGGWLKDRLDSELQSGRCIFTNLEELDEFIAAILSTKNRWLNKGGFTPAQLVFGELPRIPGELLAEDELGLHGLHDAHEDPAEVDEAAGGEISLKELSLQEKEQFDKSDELEWSAVLGTGAVKVIVGKAASKARENWPDRIISSRMVRRKKPQPELNAWKAKSRWCIHGHHDPDTGTLCTYSPTPSTEGLMTFLQTGLNFGMKFAFSDVKNAFCQSDKLNRPRGPLFAEPCEGLHLPEGALIEILVPTYGLDDAPREWRLTVTRFLASLSFEKNLVEPCWYTLFSDKRECLAQVLVEVDDFIVCAAPDHYDWLKSELTKRFHFGKWEEDEAEYAGRHIRVMSDSIHVDQSKYIQEQVKPIPLAKGRRSTPDDLLSKEEFNLLRSLVFKINWLARESRPEASGLASLMAGRLPNAQVSDVQVINKYVNFLRSTHDRPLKIWRFHPENVCFVVCSDAGGINMKGVDQVDHEGLPLDATQGAWMVLAAERLPEGNRAVRASPITWRSSRLKRKVFSTFGGETQAMLQGVNEVDWLQVMYRDATKHDVSLSCWRNSLSPHMLIMRGQCSLADRQGQCSVTDAKSLYDCLLRENPSGKQDRKSALELAIILRDLQDTKSMVRWVPHQKMLVDCVTKLDPSRANDALNQFVKSGWLSLVDVPTELKHRRDDPAYKRRSHAASSKRLEYEEQHRILMSFFLSALVNGSWGNCNDSPLDTMIPC
eukprot:g21468.t2